MAEQIARGPAGHDLGRISIHPAPAVQTKGAEGARAAAALGPAKQAVVEGATRGGEPLPEAVRADLEPRFGHAFGDVRVHADASAERAADELHARAFTVGHHIGFARGEYAPASPRGKELLAHELTHVVQQRGAPAVLQRFSTEDCAEADITKITESHDHAKTMLQNAISRLNASPVTAETQTHFANHFGAYAEWRRDIVVGHLERDLSLLSDSEMTYECESECDEGEPAYTYWIFGDIHICLEWLRTQVLNERAETFIHEMHHWDVPRGHLDLGYHRNNADAHTSWLVAVNNADAYSELVQDLYEQP